MTLIATSTNTKKYFKRVVINIEIWLFITSIMLVGATLMLSYEIVKAADIQVIKNTIDYINKENDKRRRRLQYKKGSYILSIKPDLTDKLEMLLIERSGIRQYIPFFNFYMLVITCLLVFIFTLKPVYSVLLFIPSTIVICVVLAAIPIFLLDLLARYNSEKVRGQISTTLSIVVGKCGVKDDIFYAFNKALEDIEEPMKTYIEDLLTQVKGGMSREDALEILKTKVNNPQFKDLVTNIQFNIQSGGNTYLLLDGLKKDFYRIETEYKRLKISTLSDKLLIYAVMSGVFYGCYSFIRFNPKAHEFFLGALEGKIYLTIFIVIFAVGVYVMSDIRKFEY